MERNYIILGANTPDGEKPDKVICQLVKEDIDKFKSLGKAFGINMGHCLDIGLKHKENFWERVCAYTISQDDEEAKKFSQATGKNYFCVEFFEIANRKAKF